MQIRTVSDADASKWNAYVDGHEHGSFCHLYGWKRVIEKAAKHKCFFLAAFDHENILGVLPLAHSKSWLFGNVLISTPFCMYGGAIADSADIEQALVQKACKLAEDLSVDYLELRYDRDVDTGLETKSAHSFFVKPLQDSSEAILQSIKKKQRAVVRHSLKNTLEYRIDNDLDTLFTIYSTSVRNLGTPVFPKALFSVLLEEFSEACDILTVEHQGKALSSVMSFYYKGKVMPYYGGGLAEARNSKSNDFMYYQLMCHGQKRGATEFDFGRSKNDSGAFKYKATWGIDAQPIYHHYYLVNAQTLPNLSPNNPKYRALISVWQKLPLAVSQFLGPYLSRYLG